MTGASFADHFSGHAHEYASSRPVYPDELFDWIAAHAPRRDVVWDCATGNGQAALPLARRFGRVIATDGSLDQLGHAARDPRVLYVRALAELPPLRDRVADVCTVAQAAHWFDLDAFHAAVRRVVRPGGLVVLWCYANMRVDDEADAVVEELYGPVLGSYWPPRRRHIETDYRELPMPYEELEPPRVAMRCAWTCEQALAYLRTWSAAQRHLRATGVDAVAQIALALRAAWGDGPREVRWPLHLRVGRVPLSR